MLWTAARLVAGLEVKTGTNALVDEVGDRAAPAARALSEFEVVLEA